MSPSIRTGSALTCVSMMALMSGSGSAVPAEPELLPRPVGWPVPAPAPEPPGPIYAPPLSDSDELPAGVPLIYEHTPDAGPDETFSLVGDGLTPELRIWGAGQSAEPGRGWAAKVQFTGEGYLAATLPERAPDAPFLVWVHNRSGWSRPFRLNVPQPWWCSPDRASPGSSIRIFGRDLARRPDRTTGFVYLCKPGEPGHWLPVTAAAKYSLSVHLPEEIEAADYEIWVHAGRGGPFAWGGPVRFTVAPSRTRPGNQDRVALLTPEQTPDLQASLDETGRRGGGTLCLEKGVFISHGTLRIPAGVVLRGMGTKDTRIQFETTPSSQYARLALTGWGLAPSAIHSVGDMMAYSVHFPSDGEWIVWLRYATEMSLWGQPGVSGKMTIQLDDGPAVPLENLPNTGSFGTFKWSCCARLRAGAGEHTLRWRNTGGGGISLDAFVFVLDPVYQPSDNPYPVDDRGTVVVQGEDTTEFVTREGHLPGDDVPAVWLSGDGAGVEDLTISGNPRVNLGVAVRNVDATVWIDGCRIERVRISDIEGKQAENCGVRLFKASHAIVQENEIWARCPLYFSGVRQCRFTGNRLVSLTLWGGNAEAAIQGRCDTVEECVIETNRIACPPGAEAGGATARRLIWISTGHGSVSHNYLAGNGVEAAAGPGADVGAGQARFGGVAGTDQNVGEMILFEANHRTMFFGPIAGADEAGITLPGLLPRTPDDRLGSVRREQLAHDPDGNEVPFFPPDADDGTPEPPIHEYYVSIFRGPGQGQTRRVVRREGDRLFLDRPWRQVPGAGSIVTVGTAFYQNLIVGNYTPDGMTGIQLWISCIENVVSGNTVARHRKQGLFLYANGTTLASSMPRTWNRGISPLFFNQVEGTRTDECSAGALVTSGDAGNLPIEFPRALGNVLRHNSFIRNRTDGVIIVSRKGDAAKGDVSPSILGTVVEFNVVRDAETGYHAASGSDGVVFRRNHACFWYPVSLSTKPPVAFQIDTPGATVAVGENSVEGRMGVPDKAVVPLKQADASLQEKQQQ